MKSMTPRAPFPAGTSRSTAVASSISSTGNRTVNTVIAKPGSDACSAFSVNWAARAPVGSNGTRRAMSGASSGPATIAVGNPMISA